MKGKFKLLDTWLSKTIIKHPLIIIFIAFWIFSDEMTTGEVFVLVALIYLALTYSYRLQQYESEATHYLSFGLWNSYKYNYERLNIISQQYTDLKDEAEGLAYKEIIPYKLKNGKLEGFKPSGELVKLNEKLWEVGKNYTGAEKRRDSSAKSFLYQIKKVYESDDLGWMKEITEGDKKPPFDDWRYYQRLSNDLDKDLAE